MQYWTRLTVFVIIALIAATMAVMGFWIDGQAYENRDLRDKIAVKNEEITRLELGNGAMDILIKNLRTDNLYLTIAKNDLSDKLLAKEATLDYAKAIIHTQMAYMDFIEAVADAQELALPEIVYPEPNYAGILDILFGEED